MWWRSFHFSARFFTHSQCFKITQSVVFEFWILAFSTNFGPIKTDLSGNTVWPQAADFQKLAKMDNFCHFWLTYVHSKRKRSLLRSQCWMRPFPVIFKHHAHFLSKTTDLLTGRKGSWISSTISYIELLQQSAPFSLFTTSFMVCATLTFNFNISRCLKITEKVSFNIASEASYVYILSGHKLIKNAKNGPFWRVFENLKLAVKQCYQTGQF